MILLMFTFFFFHQVQIFGHKLYRVLQLFFQMELFCLNDFNRSIQTLLWIFWLQDKLLNTMTF
jgi:hypothetical protein